MSNDTPLLLHSSMIGYLLSRYDSRISLFALFRSTALLKLRDTENPARTLGVLHAL